MTSAQNVRFKSTLRLRQPRARREQQQFLIDGHRELTLAARSGIEIRELWIDAARWETAEVDQLVQACAPSQPQLILVPASLFDRIRYGNRSDAAVAVARTPSRTRLDKMTLTENPCVLVLERLEKPGNIGAILRSADGAGMDAVILVDPLTDLFNPNAIRASRGTIFTLPIAMADTSKAQQWIRRQPLTIAVARVDGAIDYAAYDYRQPTAIVLGNEAEGVSPAWCEAGDVGISLPMCGYADSLNVSNTAAVICYEAHRQRQ